MIVSLQYYCYTYCGAPVTDADFPRLEARAERVISQMSYGRASNFDALPALQQESVMNAICAQIEYYNEVGMSVAVTGDTGSGGWSVGKVKVYGGSNQRGVYASMLCPGAVAALEQSGLLHPGVDTIDAPGPIRGWW